MTGDYEHTREFRDAERAYLTEPDRTERDDFNDDVQEADPTPEELALTEQIRAEFFARWREATRAQA